MKPREKLVGPLNKALERAGLAYRVTSADTFDRAHTGRWQRTEGACRWWVTAELPDHPGSQITILSWDTMKECAKRSGELEIRRGVVDWEVGLPNGN